MNAECESEHLVAITGTILKRQWKQDEKTIGGATEEEMKLENCLGDLKRGSCSSRMGNQQGPQIWHEWEVINNVSRKRANMLLESLPGRRCVLCVEMM